VAILYELTPSVTRNVRRRATLLQPGYSLNPLARNEPLVACRRRIIGHPQCTSVGGRNVRC
jgi:hypothetical protein